MRDFDGFIPFVFVITFAFAIFRSKILSEQSDVHKQRKETKLKKIETRPQWTSIPSSQEPPPY